MSKELETLKSIKFGCCNFENRELYKDEFEIIEKALKDYEKIKFEYSELRTYHYDLLKENERLHNQKVKKLKALEIIKEKKVNVNCIISGWSLWKYNSYKTHINLTKEEYELLKEVLL